MFFRSKKNTSRPPNNSSPPSRTSHPAASPSSTTSAATPTAAARLPRSKAWTLLPAQLHAQGQEYVTVRSSAGFLTLRKQLRNCATPSLGGALDRPQHGAFRSSRSGRPKTAAAARSSSPVARWFYDAPADRRFMPSSRAICRSSGFEARFFGSRPRFSSVLKDPERKTGAGFPLKCIINLLVTSPGTETS